MRLTAPAANKSGKSEKPGFSEMFSFFRNSSTAKKLGLFTANRPTTARPMKARYKYPFYPTNQQKQGWARLLGCVRAVGNDALALCKTSEKLLSYNQLSGWLTASKKTSELLGLGDVSSVPLQQSWRESGWDIATTLNGHRENI
jgi:hypothetical protein